MTGPALAFEDRVALVTGAGTGLGRAHALLLAERGARVVVNDLGTHVDGTGASRRRADAVVDEIRAAGGIAVADHHSVASPEGAETMVRTAIAELGGLDIVVSNAGTLRDATIANVTPEDLAAVLDVHLVGAFNVVRAAWPHLTARGYGRIVTTTSMSGLLGSFGQASYAAAKMGVVGLTRVLALEGAKTGIAANAIAPMAHTRMTAQAVGDEVALLRPELVAPVVAWLAHERCPLSGEVLSAGGGTVARFFVGLTPGWSGPDLTVEAVAEHIDEICATDGFWMPRSGVEQVLAVLDGLRTEPALSPGAGA